jgi:type II secretory pathway component GspD/PulD (secretin)
MFKITLIAAAAALTTLAGCSSFTSPEMAKTVHARATQTADSLIASNYRVLETEVREDAYIRGVAVDYVSPREGSVSMNVVGQPLFAVFQGVAEQSKYAAIVASDVDVKKLVTLDLRRTSHDQALRDIAAAAGYVVVFDHSRKIVTLTQRATYTFRLPTRLFNDNVVSTYSLSNSPNGAAAGASSGGATASSSSATVRGGSIKADSSKLRDFLQTMAGADSEVTLLPNEGIITVRAKAQQLKRVQDFLTDYAKSSMTQVDIDVAMVQVTMSDDMSTGIDWEKIIRAAGSRTIGVSLSSASSVATPAGALTYTSASVSALVNVLEKTNNAKILTRQHFPTFNNSVAMLFDGKQVPYIGKIAQTVSGASGSTTSSGEFSYAMDGISTAVFTNVLDNYQAELTLLPVISTIEGFSTASIGGNTITAPIQPLSQGYFPFMAHHGQTMIFAGTSFGKETLGKTGLPGITSTALNTLLGGNADSRTQRELVFLVRANIVPVQKFNPLIGESL